MDTLRKHSRSILAASLLLLLIGVITAPQAAQAVTPPSPNQVVQRAWQQAQEASAYRFTTEIVQTTYPAPALANVGRSSQTDTLYIEGQTDLPAHTLHMTLWQGGGSLLNPTDGVEVRIEGDRAYGRQSGMPWQEINDFSSAFAPGKDLMAYLAGAKNTRKLSTETHVLPSSASGERITYTRYAFDVDGPAFAHHLRDQMESYLQETGELPVGLMLEAPDQLRETTGEGEVWIDSRGLPLRLAVHLIYPPEANGQRVEADVKTDFSGFPPQLAEDRRVPFIQRVIGNLGLPRTPREWQRLGQMAALGAGSLGLLTLLVAYRRSRKVYAIFVMVISIAMVVTPLLQSHHVHAYSQRMAARQAEQEQRQQDQEAAQEAKGALHTSNWDPHQDPLTIEEQPQVSDSLPPLSPFAFGLSLQATETITNPTGDDDGDMLTNIQELRLGTALDDADSDGDGITDNVEVAGFEGIGGAMWYLDPLNPDSNVDGLADTLECTQLLRTSLDALSPAGTCQDTDGDTVPDVFDRDNDDDGVDDEVDLSPFSARGSAGASFGYNDPFNLTVIGLGAGEPVLVDFQMRTANPDHLSYALNVLDWPSGDTQGQIQRVLNTTFAADLTRAQRESHPSAANGDMRLLPMMEIEMGGDDIPLPLTTPAMTVQWRDGISGTVTMSQAGDDVLLDFTDWPDRTVRHYFTIHEGPCMALGDEWFGPFSVEASDTSYTIVDRKLVNFADGLHAIKVYDNAAEEDGVCATIGNVVNGPYRNKMVDPEPLKMYGISVREMVEGGTLLAYVPLSIVEDNTGGARAAFAGRMFYRAGTGGWGNAQQMRLVWAVHMKADWCNMKDFSASSDEAYDEELEAWCEQSNHRIERTQIVHTYYDDWYLTGLSVREDHGTSVAIAYENPLTDQYPESDDNLWGLAKGLEASFVTGRTGDDDQRDMTPLTIKQRFDPVSGSSTEEERWGIPEDALLVEYHPASDFPHQGYLGHIPMTYTPEILERDFMQGGQPLAEAPSLLFAREEHYRFLNLDEISMGGDTGNALDLTGLPVGISAAVQWAPYRYRNGEWQIYPIAEYMDLLELRLGEMFKEIPEFYDPTDPDSKYALDAEIMTGQAYYIAFYQGIASFVQSGPTVHKQTDIVVTDRQLLHETYQWVKKGFPVGSNPITSAIVEKILTKIAVYQFLQAYDKAYPSAIKVLGFFDLAKMFGRWYAVKDKAKGIATSIAKGIKGAVKGAAGAVLDKLKEVHKFVQGHKGLSMGLAIVGTILALATLAVLITLAVSSKWETVIATVCLGLSILSLVFAIKNYVQLGTAHGLQSTWALSVFGKSVNVTKAAGIIGLIIGIAVAIGFFVYAWVSSGVGFLSLSFNAMVSQTVAQIIVAVILFAIGMIPVVGPIIVAIIGLIDALVYLVCGIISDFTGEKAQEHVVGQWLCRGATGLVGELIRNIIYDAHDLVDMTSPDRVQIFDFDQAMLAPEKGIVPGSTLRYNTSVTTTIQIAHVIPNWEEVLEGWKNGTRLIPIDWKSLAYFYQFNNTQLRTSHFDYELQTEQLDVHEGLSRYSKDEGKTVWDTTESDIPTLGRVPFFVAQSADATDITLDEAGVNRQMELYLSEGFATPIQECWVVPNPPGCVLAPYAPFICLAPVCHIRTHDGTNHIDLGQRLFLDIFPETLDGFYDLVPKNGGYSLGWGQDGDVTFPRQQDADGDELLGQASGGSDPDDSKWDTDGDGLSDPFEYEVGSDPTHPDRDDDGLTDKEELRLGTDFYKQDTDGDGLTDAEEVAGWEFVYDITPGGEQLSTWVRSDPLSADADVDGLNDFKERVYGFHPNVASTANILDLESVLNEAQAPHLLLRFEEGEGATTFADTSGYEQAASSCSGDSCPLSAEGKYGSGLQFDGSDDWIEGPDFDIGDDFTIALWVNPDATSDGQVFVGKHTASGGNLIVFGFRNGGYSFRLRGDSHAAGTKTTGWQHLAVVGEKTGGSTTQVTVYKNGNQLWQQTLNAVAGNVTGKGWAIGQEWDSNTPSDFFDGTVDEVTIFDSALSPTQVRRIRDGRYDPNDMFVRGDTTLRYEATVENQLLGRYAQGLLYSDFPAAVFSNPTIAPVPFVLQPQEAEVMVGTVDVASGLASGTAVSVTQAADALITDWRVQSGFARMWLPLNESSAATTFQDYSGLLPPRNGTCSGGSCPLREQPGYFDHGVTFDGTNDRIVLKDAEMLGLKDGSFTVSAWVNGSDFFGDHKAIMGTDETATNHGLYLVLQDGEPHMGFAGNFLHSDFELSLDQWYHLVFRYNKDKQQMAIFVNGEPKAIEGGHAAFQGSGTVYLGRARSGNYFQGSMDDVRIFGRALTRDEIRLLHGQPVLNIDFEPNIPGLLDDKSGFDNMFSGGSCPTPTDKGIRGQAAEFTGDDHCSWFMTQSLDLKDSAFTFSAWLHPLPPVYPYVEGIFGSYSSYRDTDHANTDEARWSYPSLFRDNRKLRFGFGDGDTWQYVDTGNVLTNEAWNHVVVTFGPIYDQYDNFVENRTTIYVNGAEVASQSHGDSAPDPHWLYNPMISIGRASWKGRVYIDGFKVLDEKDGVGKAELCIAWDGAEIYSQTGVEDNKGDGQWYDVDHQEIFVNEGRLRFWEDDRQFTGKGEFCGAGPDDGDDPLDGGSRDEGGWRFSTYGTYGYGYDVSERYFSGDTEGTFSVGLDNPSRPYRGLMDDLLLYKRALGTEEVLELYLSASAAMRLPLDEPPGSDTFANVLDLSRQSDAFCSGDGCPTAGASGRDNQAALFDGSDDVLESTVSIKQTSQSKGVTMMAWVRPSSASSGEHHVISTDTGGYDWSLLRNGGNWAFYTGVSPQSVPASVDVDRWQHIAVVYNPKQATIQLYKNGVLDVSIPGIFYDTASGPIAIGAKPGGGRHFDGRIDDVRVFDRPLSGTDIARIYRSASVLQLHLDEPLGARRFTDSSGNDLHGTCSRLTGYYDRCPKVGEGVEGQVSLAAEFDGQDDFITVPDDDRLDLTKFSIAAWVKPSAVLTTGVQTLVRKGAYTDINYFLYLATGGLTPTLSFDDCRPAYQVDRRVQADMPLLMEQWNHVVTTYDRREVRLYVNGYLQGSQLVSGTPCTNDEPLRVGQSGLSPVGRIDEVTVYDHALSAYEVRDKFLYQGRLVEDRQSHRVIVDEEDPVSALRSYTATLPYRADAYVMMHVEAHDATSGVAIVEMGVQAPGESTYTWTAAPPCGDAGGGAAWCPSFDPTQLSGEGRYRLRTRAIDYVGRRETPAETYTIYVDGTPPNITTPLAGTLIGALPHPSRPDGWIVPLAGTVSDPDLPGGFPGSGLLPDSVQVTLLTPGGAIAGEGTQRATVSGTDWSVDYVFTGAPPVGAFTLRVEAADLAPTADGLGNTTVVELGTIVVDTTPPGVELDVRDVPSTTFASGQSLGGIVSEQPILPGTVLHLHLEEAAGATTFYDSSGWDHNGECLGIGCPTAGETGQYGQALLFDGTFDFIDIPSSSGLDLSGGRFSQAFWIYPTIGDDFAHGVLGWESATADRYNYPSVWVYERTKIRAGFGDGTDWNSLTTDDVLTPNAWNHVALTFDGTSYKVYVDGVERFSTDDYAGRTPWPEKRLLVGNTGASMYFDGRLDEVLILNRALGPNQVRALAQDPVAGVDAVQVAMTPILPGSPHFNEPPLAGEALHLPLEDTPDEHGTLAFHDIAGQDQWGTCAGSTCPQTGIRGHIGNAALFDGDDHVDVADFGGFTETTVSAWVRRLGNSTTEGSIVAYKAQSDCGFELAVGGPQAISPGGGPIINQYRFSVRIGGQWYSVEPLVSILPNKWVHLVGTYDGQTLRLYRDGEQVDELAVLGAMEQCSADTVIGTGFDGVIDDVRVLDRALSPDEIISLHQGSEPGLVLPLDEDWVTNGATLPDTSGWFNDGTLHTAGNPGNIAVTGQVGPYALNLEGGNHYVTVPDSSSLDLDTFSVGGWIMPYWTTSQPQLLVTKLDLGYFYRHRENYGLYLYQYDTSSGRIGFSFGDCTTHHTYTSIGNVDWRAWNHVMMTYDGAHLALYLNGELDRSVALSSPPCQNDGAVTIGGGKTSSTLRPFAGSIDDVRIYPRALTEQEVKALHLGGWLDASLDQSGAGVKMTDWTIQVPDGLEGSYRFDLRGEDVLGQLGDSRLGVWSTGVDTLAPRLYLTRTTIGTTHHYTLVAQDYNLSEDQFQLPCDASTITDREYFESPWYLAYSGQIAGRSQKLYGLTAECNLPAWALPGEVGHYDTSGLTYGVVVSGTYVYLADGEAGLQILDISDPADPRLVGTYDTPGDARDVALPVASDGGIPDESIPDDIVFYDDPPYRPAGRGLLSYSQREVEPTSYASIPTPVESPDVIVPNVVAGRTMLAPAATFTVTATSPAGNGREISRSGIISATFDRAVQASTVSTATFTVRGQQTGVYEGSYTTSTVVQFDATADYRPGEEIVVNLSQGMQATDGSDLAPYTWQFRAAVAGGTGVFTDSGQLMGNEGTYGLALGDLDDDGDLDAVATGYPTNTIWLNNATGVFIDSGQNLGTSLSWDVALGDLDSDGDLDAFVAHGDTFTGLPNRVWLNNGGTFADSAQTLGSEGTFAVALGDLDGDGDLDAFFGNDGANQVWTNDGSGVFTTTGQSLGASETHAVALSDLDGDGDLDALVGNWGQTDEIWVNDGTGVFTTTGQSLGNSTATYSAVLGDLDGDGDLDAVFGYTSPSGNEVWLNDGGVFTDTGQTLSSTGTYGVALGDLDDDGDLDAFFADGGETPRPNTVWLNDGTAVFTASQSLGSEGSTAVALGDLDGDGDLDAFIGNEAGLGAPNTVWINNANSPTANDDTFAVPQDSSANTLNVLANDEDLDGDALLLIAVGVPDQGGTATISGTSVISYTPMTGYFGAEVFTYTISDPGGLTGTATVIVTVGGVNNPPDAQDDTDTTPEDTAVTIDVLSNDTDPDGQTLFISDAGTPGNGSTAIAGDQIIYTPSSDFNGVDVFTYVASDGWLTDTASVTVTVNAVEDAPTLDPISDQTTSEDAITQTVTLSNITSGAFNESQALAVTAQTIVNPGIIPDPIVTYTSPATTGNLDFRPVADQFGNARVEVTVTDGVSTTTRTFWITVNAVNDPPTLNPISDLAIAEDSPEQTVNLTGIDYGPINENTQRPNLAVTATSTNTALIPHPIVSYDNGPGTYPSGSLAFTPVADQFGQATVFVTVTDGISETVRSFQVTVDPVNDPPTLDPISDRTIAENSPEQTVNLTGISYGPANENAQRPNLAVTAVSTNTALIPHPTVNYNNGPGTYTGGSLTFTPVTDQFGRATVIVTVSDGISDTVRTFQVIVNTGRPLVYVADGSGGLRLVDNSDPTDPQPVGAYGTWFAYGVAISNTHAYVAAGYSGLRAIDVSEPAYPQEVDDIGFGGDARAVAISGKYAFVADGGRKQIRVVDISDPDSLSQVTTYSTPWWAYDVAISEPDSMGHTYAYVACGTAGIHVIDITDPAAPVFAGELDTHDARGVALYEPDSLGQVYAYVADGSFGMRVVDVTNPNAPAPVSTFSTPGTTLGVASSDGLVYVADFNRGLRVINPAGRTQEATACDMAGNCATTSLPPMAPDRLSAALQAGAAIEVSLSIPPVLGSTNPISVTGQAAVTTTTSLRALTVTVGSTLIHADAWAAGTVTETNWATTWTPAGPGVYLLKAAVSDWDDNTASDAVTVTVDTDLPVVSIAPTVLTATRYHPPRAIDITGLVTDTGGVASVHATLAHDGLPIAAVVAVGSAPSTWLATWHLGSDPLPDGETYTVTAEAVDIVGRTVLVTEPLTVDVVPPKSITPTLSYSGSILMPGDILRESTAALTLTWTAGSDGSGVAGYPVDWAVVVSDTTHHTSYIAALDPRTSQYLAEDGQKVTAWLAGEDVYGHQGWQSVGPVYVDGPLTPDYVILDDTTCMYRGWMDSGCSLVGVDRRAARNTPGGVFDPQQFYATWNAEGLRLAWTGANWETDGDLFIYLDTAPSVGTATAYNPYSATAGTTIYLPGATPSSTAGALAADALVWVQDSHTALLMTWDGSAWISDTLLTPAWYQFDTTLSGDITDLYLPLDLIGLDAGDSLDLVAFATEEGALRLWATAPASNPTNSSRAVGRGAFASEDHEFALNHGYHWDSLSAGVCPNGSDGSAPVHYADTDVQVRIEATPSGTSYSFLQDGLFWLWDLLLDNPPADVTSLFDFLAADHPRVIDGQTIAYTIYYRNLGSETATGVYADVKAKHGLQVVGGDQQIPMGDIDPSEEGSITFDGIVDWNPSIPPWAAVEVQIYDSAHGPSGPPLEWLWAYHQVDDGAPEFFGIQQPRYVVGPGTNHMTGYAYDDSGVPLMTLHVQPPSGPGSTIACPDAAPLDGQWACDWDVTASNGGTVPAHGAQFDVQLQATDGFGQSGWSTWQPFIVDSLPPTVTLDVATSGVSHDSVVQDASLTLVGGALDDGGVKRVEVCVDELCETANLQPADGLSQVAYEDMPGNPIVVDGGCFERYFDVAEAFTIAQVHLGFVAAHDRRDDLQIELQSPDGTTVRLLADDEVSGTEFHNYDLLLHDAAMQVYSTSEDDPAWPYYDRPARPYAPLSAFQGEGSDGLWTLRICDLNGATNDGTYVRSLLRLWPRQVQLAPSARWSYDLLNVGVADYVSQTIAIYGEDAVGNRSAQPLSMTIWIDNVSPAITVTQIVADAQAAESEAFVSGLVQDGGPLSGVYVMIEPPAGDPYIEPAVLDGDTWQYTLQSDTGGQYRLWFSAADLAGNLATDGPYEINMPAPPGPPSIYLPLVFQGPAPLATPDLTVSDQVLLVSTSDTEIVIVNQGEASVTTEFRVDLYFDPAHVPQSGDRWSDIATYGAHWIVSASSQPLAPAGRITLTLESAAGDNYPDQIADFDHAYIQVETLNTVLETDETNNVIAIDIYDIDEPDLIVENLIVTVNDIQVVIKNQGEGTVNDEFWVDVYIDPDPVPTGTNQIWENIASEGMVWGVTTDLRPGEVLTLTIGDAYYEAAYSDVDWPLSVGTPVYAQVDSTNANTRYGGVLEMHEALGGVYNNIAGPVPATAADSGDSPPVRRDSWHTLLD